MGKPVVKKSNIEIAIGLNEDKHPETIHWKSDDNPNGQDFTECKAIMLSLFDKEYKDPYGWDGELYKNKLFKKIRPIIPYCKVSILWDKDGVLDYKDAPTDKGKETLLKLLDDKVEITMEDITLEGTYYV